jgi:hypothetical protein
VPLLISNEVIGHQKTSIMKKITLTIANVDRIGSIQERLAKNRAISSNDKLYLPQILSQILSTDAVLTDKISLQEAFDVNIWDQNDANLIYWVELLNIGPGWDYAPFCYLVVEEDKVMLGKNVIIMAQFAPCMSRNLDTSKRGFEYGLKTMAWLCFGFPPSKTQNNILIYITSKEHGNRRIMYYWKHGKMAGQ